MVTNGQVKKLIKVRRSGMSIENSANKTNMCRKTASKYISANKLPSELKKDHNWCTRKDPFSNDWDYIKSFLENNDSVEAKALFEHLNIISPFKYTEGQLRTLQRKIKIWKATDGPPKDIIFEQNHYPGVLCASDFTNMDELEITINNILFKHKLFHFVLTYSNWETGTVCFSESFESLSDGLQNALWELGGGTEKHRTDRLSAAVNNLGDSKEFTKRYEELLEHYKIQGQKTQPYSPHENGDAEQSHYRYKKAIRQALIIRGSNNFNSQKEYEQFIKKIFDQLNSSRMENLYKELNHLKKLPNRRLEDYREIISRVTRHSTIRVLKNSYSLHSRLIGEKVKVKIFARHIEVFYGQKKIESIPRIIGKNKHNIQYRDIIDSLIRKPGAFENYKYKNDLFPTSYFRIAYDQLTKCNPAKASREYLKILYLAAKENEDLVNQAITFLVDNEILISFDAVNKIVKEKTSLPTAAEVNIPPVDLSIFDSLLYQEVN